MDLSMRHFNAISLLVLTLLLACSRSTPETRPSASPSRTDEIMPSASPPQPGETTPTSSPSQLQNTLLAAPPEPAQGSIYYVRPDGGDSEQCTGLVDAAYPGSGTGQPCAWDHPFRALPPGNPPRIAGGDALIIASGSFQMGLGAPGAADGDVCHSDYPWDCHMPPIPSGPDPTRPTRVLGEGWEEGCPSPPQLWGTERAATVINLSGASNVEIACLEITDHAGCAEDHTGGLACERDGYPYGEWAADGLYAEDSSNVYLHDVNIHGMASAGIRAGRLTDWTVEDVRLAANGWIGWEGDIEGQDANAGTLTFRRWTVAWNGCVETFPGQQPAGCWDENVGGYGDGVGTGATGGDWIIEDSAFLHNTSDGLDLLYHRLGGGITIRRTVAEGNAGDQIKTTGPTVIENVIAVSYCSFFEGGSFTHSVGSCRAGGSAIALTLGPGDAASVINATVTGQGDCLIIAECTEGERCDGSESVLLQNSIFRGNREFGSSDDTTCLAWYGTAHDPFIIKTSIINGVKGTPDPCPPGSMCDVWPGLVDDCIDSFDAHLLPDSPAIDAGDDAPCPSTDVWSTLRPLDGDEDGDAVCDIGAHEYGP